MSAPATVEVRITRTYSASAERVLDAWLDPNPIGRRMFGPALRDEKALRIDVDARVGLRADFDACDGP